MSNSINGNRKRRCTLGARDPVSCSLLFSTLQFSAGCLNSQHVCKENKIPKPSLWKQKRVISLLTCLGQFIPLLLHYNHALQSIVKIAVCFQLPEVLCILLSGSLSMLCGQAGLFNSAVTSHEDTLENISAAGLIVGVGFAFR